MSKREHLLKKERNKEIVKVFFILSEKCWKNGTRPKLANIAEEAAKVPSSRFWVTEERAMAVISAWMSHDKNGNPYPYYADPSTMSYTRLSMFNEIYSRYKILARRFKGQKPIDIMCRVVSSPAPCFYTTPKSMLVYFSQSRNHKKHDNNK